LSNKHKIGEKVNERTELEINDDPTSIRSILQEIISQLRGPDGKPKSRAQALAVTKLQEAAFWLGEDMFGFKEPERPNVTPQADRLAALEARIEALEK
jgi:hypothetical protein